MYSAESIPEIVKSLFAASDAHGIEIKNTYRYNIVSRAKRQPVRLDLCSNGMDAFDRAGRIVR